MATTKRCNGKTRPAGSESRMKLAPAAIAAKSATPPPVNPAHSPTRDMDGETRRRRFGKLEMTEQLAREAINKFINSLMVIADLDDGQIVLRNHAEWLEDMAGSCSERLGKHEDFPGTATQQKQYFGALADAFDAFLDVDR